MTKFWNWTNEDKEPEKPNVLTLYGTIASESWFDDDVTAKMFKDELDAHPGDIELYISSPGGDVEAATQIYTMLMEHDGHVTVKIDGVAASASTIVAMAGEQILMAPSALMMIHNPACFAAGDVNEMKATIKMLNEVKESIIEAYRTKTNLDHDTISDMMDKETWMSSAKAIELGFADGIIGAENGRAVASYSFSTKAVASRLTKKVAEKAPEQEDNRASADELMAQLYKIL